MNFILILDFLVKNKIPVRVWNREDEERYVLLEQWLARPIDKTDNSIVDIVYATKIPVRKIFSPDLVKEISFDNAHEGGLTANIHLRW